MLHHAIVIVAAAGRGGRAPRPGRGGRSNRSDAPDWAKPPAEGRQKRASTSKPPPNGGGGRGERTNDGARAASSKATTSKDEPSRERAVRASDDLRAVSANASTKNFDDGGRGTTTLFDDGGRGTTLEECLRYEREGHTCIRGAVDAMEMIPMVKALSGEIMSRRMEAYRHRVSVLCPQVDARELRDVEDAKRALKKHSQEDVGFLQTFNLHREQTSAAREYIMSKRFAKIAAELMGCERARIYQSCIFVKEPGMAETNWHSDLNMVPLDTNDFVTLWIPLRSLEEDDAALHFANRSHRDFSLPYWRTLEGMEDLEGRYEIDTYDELDLGDLTAHHGWCLHWSPPQPEDCVPRYALSVCYFADGARRLDTDQLRRVPHDEDAWSYDSWLKDIKPGAVAKHPELPIVWP